jgi:hypothetical protein
MSHAANRAGTKTLYPSPEATGRLNAGGVAAAGAVRSQARDMVKSPGVWSAATVAILCRYPRVVAAAQS